MPQDAPHTNVVVLGSTGSVGRSALGVIAHDGGARLKARGLGANTSVDVLVEQALEFRPRYIALADPAAAAAVDGQLRGTGIEVLSGPDGIGPDGRSDPETDRVLTAIVGAAGLHGTWAALEAGKTVALANKETLVVAGPLVMELAQAARRHPAAGRQRALGDLPGAARRRDAGGPPRDPDLVGGPVPGPKPRASWRTSPPRRRCGTRPGRWGRRSRSTRPP